MHLCTERNNEYAYTYIYIHTFSFWKTCSMYQARTQHISQVPVFVHFHSSAFCLRTCVLAFYAVGEGLPRNLQIFWQSTWHRSRRFYYKQSTAGTVILQCFQWNFGPVWPYRTQKNNEKTILATSAVAWWSTPTWEMIQFHDFSWFNHHQLHHSSDATCPKKKLVDVDVFFSLPDSLKNTVEETRGVSVRTWKLLPVRPM